MGIGIRRADAVVVGAGTTGAGAAVQLARLGMDVVLLERRPAAGAGAQWHNGVLPWQFARAGIEAPSGDELASAHGVAHLFGPDGTHAVTLPSTPTVRADMGLLGRRLRSLATDLGVELVDRIGALDVELRGPRVVAVSAEVGVVGRTRFVAPLFVDASGRSGALRRRSPALTRWCPPVRGAELCTAADVVFEVADPDGARRFLDDHGARPGEGVSTLGLHGGFSTRGIEVGPDLDRVSVLVGCLADGRHGTGPRLMDEVRAEHAWIGSPVSGGQGVIPLRRPYARISAPGLALVGDAACQVFPGHGSGIGTGLIAGKVLAEAVDGAGDPGDERVLWRYQAAFQHELGGLLAGFDGVRRMSTRLGTVGVASMVRAGLLTPPMVHAGLDQRQATPAPAALPALAARMAAAPRVAATMVPMLARIQVAHRLGARHPAEPDESALARWDAAVTRALGPLPA